MPVELSDLHFIRPQLLWLLIPALLIIFQLRQSARKQSSWQSVISPHLLEFLFVSGNKQKSRSGFFLTAVISILIIIAVSGPSFRQKSVPVFQTENARVILLDLSLSMDATDIKPSRLERAKFKLMDLLDKTKEGTVALVIYAGDAFTISPLTSDANTISSIIPTLSTGIMPVLGSRPDIGINKSIELLKNAKATQGEIIWLTDGVDSKYVDDISASIRQAPYHLSILAVGTEQGAPIPLPDGKGFLKDNSGSIVVPKLEARYLTDIANITKAGYTKLTADDSDIKYLQQYSKWQAVENKNTNANEQMISRWIDDGYWIVWVALALLLLKLIKQPSGEIISVLIPGFIPCIGLLLFSGAISKPVNAFEWNDLWHTKNQQANQAFKAGEFDKAANLFEEKHWQAASQFKNGDFADAASNFGSDGSIESLYNHATSLAKSQQLQDSLDAYNQLLEKQPEHEDALFNKNIVEALLKQQEQQNQDQENKDQESEQDKKDQESQDSDPQDQQQQDSKTEADEQKEQDEQEQQEKSDSEKQAEQKEMEASKDEREKSEKDQALEHWLEKIPDDPGGLLRRKMYREYQRRGREQKEKKLW